MPRIHVPFAGPYDERTAKAISSQLAINVYPEITETHGKQTLVMKSRPALKFNQTVNVGPYRGMLEAGGNLYFVNNNTVYKMDTAETATVLGTINTFTGRCGMASNGLHLIVVDGQDGWVYEYGTATFAQITDAHFVDAEQVGFFHGRFVVNKPGTGEFYISDSYPAHAQLVNGTGWTSLDYATAEVDPDDLVGLTVQHQQLWLFGEYTTELYFDSGDSLFPFEAQPGGFIEWGCAAPWSIAKGDNTVVWLSKNRHGQGYVVKATGFTPQVISTRAVEEAISRFTTIADAYGYVYKTDDGHLLYVLTFPTGNRSFAYDFTTNLWHEQQSFGVGRMRIATHAFFNNKHYVGDAINGNLYTLSSTTYQDNSTTISRKGRTIHHTKGYDRLFWHSLRLVFEQGVGLSSGAASNTDPQVAIRFSDDGGNTWSQERLAPLGKIGEYSAASEWYRLGQSRHRVWEWEVTAAVPVTLVDAVAEVSKGTN